MSRDEASVLIGMEEFAKKGRMSQGKKRDAQQRSSCSLVLIGTRNFDKKERMSREVLQSSSEWGICVKKNECRGMNLTWSSSGLEFFLKNGMSRGEKEDAPALQRDEREDASWKSKIKAIRGLSSTSKAKPRAKRKTVPAGTGREKTAGMRQKGATKENSRCRKDKEDQLWSLYRDGWSIKSFFADGTPGNLGPRDRYVRIR